MMEEGTPIRDYTGKIVGVHPSGQGQVRDEREYLSVNYNLGQVIDEIAAEEDRKFIEIMNAVVLNKPSDTMAAYDKELHDIRSWSMWSFYMSLVSIIAWVSWLFCMVVK
jgi:hypothetical protein